MHVFKTEIERIMLLSLQLIFFQKNDAMTKCGRQFMTTASLAMRVVWQVTATDWDAGDNGRLYYSIPGSESSVFHVDQRGVISAHESIDREHYDVFRIPVLAVDSSATLRKTGSALVIITVEDVNDERPMFLQPTYLFTVDENQPAASLV